MAPDGYSEPSPPSGFQGGPGTCPGPLRVPGWAKAPPLASRGPGRPDTLTPDPALSPDARTSRRKAHRALAPWAGTRLGCGNLEARAYRAPGSLGPLRAAGSLAPSGRQSLRTPSCPFETVGRVPRGDMNRPAQLSRTDCAEFGVVYASSPVKVELTDDSSLRRRRSPGFQGGDGSGGPRAPSVPRPARRHPVHKSRRCTGRHSKLRPIPLTRAARPLACGRLASGGRLEVLVRARCRCFG
jgi:hypothetical protein